MDHISLRDLGFDLDEINSLDESVCANIIHSREFTIAVRIDLISSKDVHSRVILGILVA